MEKIMLGRHEGWGRVFRQDEGGHVSGGGDLAELARTEWKRSYGRNRGES